MKQYGQEPAKHLYDVEVKKYDAEVGTYRKEIVAVLADTRSQASAFMKSKGFEVCSVNMVG